MWMNYGWLDPLGKGYVGNQIGAAAFESVFGSDLTIFTEVENCWRREYSRGREDMPGAVEDCQGVTTKGEGTAGRKKKQQQKIDRGRSTGPVDRHARSAPGYPGRPDRSTGEDVCRLQSSRLDSGRPDRSTGEELCKQLNSLLDLGRPDRSTGEQNPSYGNGPVDRAGRPVVGFWAKYAVSENYVFKPWL